LHRVVDRIVRQLTLRRGSAGHWLFAGILIVSCAWLAVASTTRAPGGDKIEQTGTATKGQQDGAAYRPTPKQWASLGISPVAEVVFRTEHMTEGKIAVDFLPNLATR
jgi:cobalt-zinc-cadmium efflux system membrane fusion protein